MYSRTDKAIISIIIYLSKECSDYISVLYSCIISECYPPGDLHHHPSSGKPPRLHRAMYFNRYGYFYVRLYRTGFGLPVNLVEEHIQLSSVLHIIVSLQRTWDMKLAPDKVWNSACSTSPSLASC